MHRWRYPSLSLHGIEGAFSGAGAKTVIPRKVVGKFSIRLVPNMTPEAVSQQVTSYLTKQFAELRSPNKFRVYMSHGGKPWVSDFNHPHYMAGRKALKRGRRSPWAGAGALGVSAGALPCRTGTWLWGDARSRVGVRARRHPQPTSRVAAVPRAAGRGPALEPSLAAQGSPRLLLRPPAVFGVEPDLTREGGSIPVTLTFQEATGKNVMLLPVGSADDGAHSQNEKLNR